MFSPAKRAEKAAPMIWSCGSSESAAPDAVFSSLQILGKNQDPEVLDSLVPTHDELLDRFPEHSVSVDGSSGGFMVSGVARENAGAAARLLVAWWEGLLAADLEDWPISDLTLGIGGTAEEPAVSYAVELGDPEEDDDAGPVPVPIEQNRQEDLDSGDEDEDEAAELAAAVRFHHPASKVVEG